MKKHLLLPPMLLLLSGCSLVPDRLLPENLLGRRNAPEVQTPAPEGADEEGAKIPKNARTVEEFDTTSTSDRQAALAAGQTQGAEVDLGRTIASLGDATDPGIWLKTPLVDAPAQGRVVYPAKGTSVAVELIPLAGEPGSGSRLSLAAMRLLEADLTGLPEVQVFRAR